MTVVGKMLFYNSRGVGIDDAIRAQEPKTRAMVDQIPDAEFDRRTDDELVAMIVDEARFDPLVLDFEGAKPDVKETTVRVEDRFGWGGGSVEVPAYKVTKSIPFTGDANIFDFSTGQWSTSMPQGEVRGNNLIIGMTVRTEQADEAKAYLDRTIAQINEYVPRQKAQIDAYNEGLPNRVRPLIEARRRRRGGAANLLAKL